MTSGSALPRRSARVGVTLTEVLMALMIMSIGVVSVMTLFPLSVLRTLHATQLTNGTILRQNAEARVRMHTDLVYDPDANGTRGAHDSTVYMVDPMGFNEMAPFGAPLQNAFGNVAGAPGPGSLTRHHGGANTVALANALTRLPDSWVTQTTVTLNPPLAPAVTTAALPTANLANIPTANGESRIVVFDASGKLSQTRTIDPAGIAAPNVNFSPPLSATFVPGGTVRIETEEPRYSWLLTVRRGAAAPPALILGPAEVDVVVFFSRRFVPPDELIYNATFTAGSSSATVFFPPGGKPYYKKGGWILDSQNARWYRIQNVIGETANNIVFQLERPARATGTTAILMRGIVNVFPIPGTIVPNPGTNVP